MIGAGGLGHDVLTSLKRLRIGDGVEAGLAITLLAIALDRLSQAFASRPPPAHGDTAASFARRHPFLIAAVAVLAACWLAGAAAPGLQSYPEDLEVSTAHMWSELIKWINVNFYDHLEAIKTWLLFNLLIRSSAFSPPFRGRRSSPRSPSPGTGSEAGGSRCSPPPSRCSWRSRETGRSR